MVLRRVWARWADVLEIVQPATVVRWHRAGFRAFWRWKSRPSEGAQVVALPRVGGLHHRYEWRDLA